MKNFTFLLVLLIASAGFSQNIFDFEGAAPTFGDFNGSATQVIPNPDPTGANTSANVAENTIPANAAFAGVNIPSSLIDLSANKGFTMDVWSPLANTPVLLKLESTTGPPHERLVTSTTTGAWETLTFDFSALTNETFDSVTVFMNFNVIDPGLQVYYWDNLVQTNLPPSLPLTLEGVLPAFGDFNGSSTGVIPNPDATGVNTSANVAENVVPANAAFAGVNFPINQIDLTTDKGFTMDVWSPLVNTPVLLKLESTTGPPHERLVNLTTTGAWEEVTFDFSALTNETFDSVTIFMNFNVVDPGQQVYFWDNLEQVSLAPPAPSLPITFEGGQLPVFGDFNGSATQVIANPDATGINTSANVAENTIPANAAFAGVNFPVGLIDLSTDKGFTMDVWSPLTNTPVLLKLESTTGPPHERLVNLTTTGAWEEVSFDFSALTNETFDSVTVFMNFNQTDAASQTYFWDNLEQVSLAPPAPSLPITFEGGQLPVFGDFNGSATQVTANPDATGVNTSANVAENVVPANAAFAGVNFPINQIDLTTDKGFTMDVWSPLANTPVLLKLESTTGPPHERLVNLTTTGAWEEVSFDFSALTNETFDSVTVFMNFNQTDGASQTYFWDNLEQVSLAPPAPSLPITFEGGQLPVFGDFNGSATQVIANPDATGVNTSANVAENTIPANAAFAGVNFPVGLIDVSTDKMFTMNVWSPLANTPVLLKLESTTGPPHERLVNLTTTGAWEEVSFDFSALTNETFDSVTVFMNFNQTDGASQTYFWDNLIQVTAGSDPVELPVDFENANAVYDVIGFEGADSAVEANAVPGGINTSPTVVRTIKTVGAQFFAGTVLELDVPIDFSTSEMITIKTYSPKANIPVRLKLENADGSQFVELDVNTTVVDEWEELSWDFAGMTTGIDFTKVVVFFEFIVDLPGDGSTYYFDDISVFAPPPSLVELPVDFEDPNAIYDILGFEGADSAVEANAVSGGINTSPTVVRTIKTVGAQFFAGTILELDVPIDFSVSEMISIKTYSPKADIPVRLKLENADSSQFIELDVNTTVIDEWEELVWDFTGMTAGIDFTKVVVFFEFIVDLPGDGSTYYFDDIEVFVQQNMPPANDLCENAIPMVCGEIIAGTTIDATIDDTVAPTCDTDVTAPGVWYVYEDASGLANDITITMCNGTTDYDSKLSVYSGDCGALTCVAGNDDTCGLQSEVSFQSDGTSTYYILVQGFNGAVGNFEIEMSCVLTPPVNDLIANAIDLSNATFPYTDPSVVMPAATFEAGNPMGCNLDGANGVWYKGTIPVEGTVRASITTPGGASSVTFYEAPNLNAVETDLVLVDWFENQCLPGTEATIPVVAGNSYYVFVLNSDAITDVVIEFTPLLGADENTLQGFAYYPNPTSDIVNLNSEQNIEFVEIYNMLGQKVIDQRIGTTSSELNISELATGTYLMKVMVDGETGTYRVIKE